MDGISSTEMAISGERFLMRTRQSIEASIAVKKAFLADDVLLSELARMSELLLERMRAGYKLLIFGNGGSAADAQHIAAEFVGRFAFNRPALPALALSVNTSCVTAIGNDYGFDTVFSRQIEALGRPGDVAMGITTSGSSPNVIRGVTVAKEMGLLTFGLTGAGGAALRDSVDHCLCVPSRSTPRIQECHILAGHIISELVEASLFGQGGAPGA